VEHRCRRQDFPAWWSGHKLANDGHDTRAIQAYLGHRNIQNTTRYTALAPQRFKEFFRDWDDRKSSTTDVAYVLRSWRDFRTIGAEDA
jgi:site-specific recombinase XerC